MQIYRAEQEDGLSEQIQASAKAVIPASLLILEDSPEVSGGIITKAQRYKAATEKELAYNIDRGIMVFKAILCTTNMNRNDDYFSMEETYKAMQTPVGKPVNWNHEGSEADKANQTIGTIVRTGCYDDEMHWIYAKEGKYYCYDDAGAAQEVNKFHIVVEAFLWEAYWPTVVHAIQKYIDEGIQTCSMECITDDFGYALVKEGSDIVDLLPRNEMTAWLTKALRLYKGPGTITVGNSKYRVGRWLRGITFSGMGMLDPSKKPGNPESVVFDDYKVNPYRRTESVVAAENILTFAQQRVLLNEGKNCLWLL